MEYILNSYNHKVTDNCLRFNFKKPIRFNNQKISLMEIKYYNYFENISNEFSMSVKNKNKLIIMNFENGSYNVSDINQIVDDTIQEKFNITETPITITADVNRFTILIIIKKDWELRLNPHFMNLFGFSKGILNESYHRSNLTPNVDKIKFLKLYCNLVDNEEDNEFLTDVIITGNISQQVTYENNNNIYKSKNILNSSFDYIELCIKDQNNKPVKMKDLFKISAIFLKNIYEKIKKIFQDITIQLKEEKTKYKRLKICKYSFEISKICILSLSTGLSFINVFAIISLIFIPIIDIIKNSSDVDHRLYESKLKKNLLKELLNYKTQTYTELDEEKILELYNKLVYKLSVINTS